MDLAGSGPRTESVSVVFCNRQITKQWGSLYGPCSGEVADRFREVGSDVSVARPTIISDGHIPVSQAVRRSSQPII